MNQALLYKSMNVITAVGAVSVNGLIPTAKEFMNNYSY